MLQCLPREHLVFRRHIISYTNRMMQRLPFLSFIFAKEVWCSLLIINPISYCALIFFCSIRLTKCLIDWWIELVSVMSQAMITQWLLYFASLMSLCFGPLLMWNSEFSRWFSCFVLFRRIFFQQWTIILLGTVFIEGWIKKLNIKINRRL